jgi:hypothetical protein
VESQDTIAQHAPIDESQDEPFSPWKKATKNYETFTKLKKKL